MNRYLFSIVGLGFVLLLVGAGCNPAAVDNAGENMEASDTHEEAMEEESMMEDDVMEGESEKADTMGATADVVINLTGKNFSFSQSEIKAKKGQKVTINFASKQGFHDWVVDEFDAKTERVNAPNSASVTFVANKVGSFEFYCSVGQHRELGMVGILTVEGDEVMMDNSLEDKAEVMTDAKNVEGTYEDYAVSKLSLAKEGSLVLFFHANWCPTCRTLDSNLTASRASVPDNTHILKVDYDSNVNLRQKYGVTYQHTLVQVDADGELIKKWSGGSTLADVLSEIKQ